MKRKAKLAWVRSLRVGDVVCDCRFRHVLIKSIKDEEAPRFPWLVYSLLPFSWGDWIDKHWPLRRLVDREAELEDGAWCSAMACLDPPEHNKLLHAEHPKTHRVL